MITSACIVRYMLLRFTVPLKRVAYHEIFISYQSAQSGCPLAKGPYQPTVALLVIVYGLARVRVTLVFTQNVILVIVYSLVHVQVTLVFTQNIMYKTSRYLKYICVNLSRSREGWLCSTGTQFVITFLSYFWTILGYFGVSGWSLKTFGRS